ncbi:hypothetical protein NQ315_000172 [Exocentrus adspersus]|uniref:Codanin-1 C-terminal domain-containing protein n=1 Tax=Exocentrus adspersus TaxID=1586481 RepID=A0AAV8VQW3_9CUCU|nr:hypothetical protein NQ315_000172 [Exocentrus adspersus]
MKKLKKAKFIYFRQINHQSSSNVATRRAREIFSEIWDKMAEILLDKAVNKEIQLDSFIAWISGSDQQCSRLDFLTYFLNFVHEEIPSLHKHNESLQKPSNDEAPYTLNKSYSLDENTSPNRSPSVWRGCSTPKLPRIQPELDGTPVSPVSPLYSNKICTTPKSVDKASPLRLGDFIVARKSSAKKKTTSNKRIKPTSLSQVNSSFENSFNDFQQAKELSVEEARSFLVEERFKILNKVPVSNKIVTVRANRTEVEPSLDSVTSKGALDRFLEIYTSILRNNLVLSVTSEIYFLTSLLLTKCFCDDACDEALAGVDFLTDESTGTSVFHRPVTCTELFRSIHNIVYFAVKCLESLVDVLKLYDKSMLSLLSRNKRLRSFNNRFAEKLLKISEKKRALEYPSDGNLQTNVCFDLDTDNRDNFPNDAAFHAFRKQRDLFYEVLAVWENQHLLPGWSFSSGLGGKIRSLVNLQTDPAAYVHFCRLFKAQLLGTCGKIQKDEALEDIPLPSTLPNVDIDKLNRLKSRLITKQTSNGTSSTPSFNGYEEFYRDFIAAAASYAFNRHLCDALIADILELNDTKFICTDLEEIDGSVDASTRKAYLACLKSLRVLAKFLGYVEALPYKSTSSLSNKVVAFQINSRKQTCPIFDVKNLLDTSIRQHHVILTLPWLTEYLSMLDYVTLRLPYYLSLYETLFDLYRNVEKTLPNASYYNLSLVKFTLGRLFELPNFPDSEYFSFCTRITNDSLGVPPKGKCKERKLDDIGIVDDSILYICCPYLEEIKKLLSSNAARSSVTVKHITPVTTIQNSDEVVKKRLEQQLEEAFFNGQPLSLRRTVEFVSERVASACVKHICGCLVPDFKKSALETLRGSLISWSNEENANSPTREKALKVSLRSKMNQTALSSLQALREACGKEVLSLTKARVGPSISNLLSVDVLPQTRDVCVSITTRMCVERVQQWVNSHITVAVFTKDFNVEAQKVERRSVKEKPVFQLPPGGGFKSHDEGATSAFHLLEKVKCLSMSILGNPSEVNEGLVSDLLDEAYFTLTHRCDVNECIAMYTCTLLVDVSLLLMTHKTGLMQKELLKQFLRIWRCYSGKTGDLFKSLFCPRNVMLLAQSCNDIVVWESYAVFVAFLLEENVLTCDELEAQCAGFYRKDWDQVTLGCFTAFQRKFLDCYRHGGGRR